MADRLYEVRLSSGETEHIILSSEPPAPAIEIKALRSRNVWIPVVPDVGKFIDVHAIVSFKEIK